MAGPARRRREQLMDSKLTPIVIGGLIPAVLYGVAGVFQKWSAREGGSASMYLIGFGLATMVSGLVFRVVLGEADAPPRSMVAALLGGGSFGVGAGLISWPSSGTTRPSPNSHRYTT